MPATATRELIDPHTWYILRHLHQELCTQAAAQIACGEAVQWRVCLLGPMQGAAGLQVVPLAAAFLAQAQAQPDGAQWLDHWLTDALRPGSRVRQQLARDPGLAPNYSLSVQEVLLPGHTAHEAAQPALMALVRSAGLTLPIFHRITTDAQGRRHGLLRPFPTAAEIAAVRPLLQAPLSASSLRQ